MKHIRKSLALILCIITTLCLAGCTMTTEVVNNELTEESASNTTAVLKPIFGDEQTAVTETIPVDGENFSLVCTYDTGDYPLNDWRITANKTINMTVNTTPLPEGYTVHIEHVHADIVIKATTPGADGITQDSMDDSDHRVPSKGFPISDTIYYNNLFAIEGYTDKFYEMWGYACGGYGSVSSSYQRMTEGNLRKAGCYAEKLMVVYDIIITPPGMEEGYVKSVYSELMIPLVSEIEYVEKDFWTGEIVEPVTESLPTGTEETTN